MRKRSELSPRAEEALSLCRKAYNEWQEAAQSPVYSARDANKARIAFETSALTLFIRLDVETDEE